MSPIPELIRFDWAMKRLLRDKANYEVLEGLLTTLLGREIKIDTILESESNQDDAEMKYNRVDMIAQSTDGEKMLIEVQNQSEIAYFHRILFGTSRLVSDYLKLGDDYGKIAKIYSINIVYFNLGEGEDSVYIGETEFVGLHDKSRLQLPDVWKRKLKVDSITDIFPTYYLLRVNDFDRWSRVPLDQWLYFLSKGRLQGEPTAPGLDAVREKLRLDSLSSEERLSYLKKLDDSRSIRNSLEDARYEGLVEGEKIGLEKGKAQGIAEGKAQGIAEGKAQGIAEGKAQGIVEGELLGIKKVAKNLLAAGADIATVARATGLSEEELQGLL